MANWADTSYAIEGNMQILEKIYKAILNPEVEEGSSDNWEGNVLNTLDIKWVPYGRDKKNGKIAVRGNYLRGFIHRDTVRIEDYTLRFDAEEAWGLTDFHKVLENEFSDNIKIYWVVTELGNNIYRTNDVDGKYFPDKYFVGACIDGDYYSEYFRTEEFAYKWLSEISGNRVNCKEDLSKIDNPDFFPNEDDYIFVRKIDIM